MNQLNQPTKATTTSQKPVFHDLSTEDKKIPRSLIMMYEGKPFVLKAGLEYKANLLFKGGNWGVTTEIIERQPDYVLAKATLKTKDGVEFSNYGEASKANVSDPEMHKYLLHVALTRAECRVLRMATASAYTSAEEMDWYSEGKNGVKEIPASEEDNKPALETQLATIKQLGGDPTNMKLTQGEAKEIIADLLKK